MYDNKHKYFLQYMLQNGCVPTENALQFCKNHTEEINDVKSLKEFINVINQQISKQELKISIGKCEFSGDEKVLLLNSGNDEISKLQIAFVPAELEYFQAILNDIVTSADRKIKKMACFNLTGSLKGNITKENAERLLNRWNSEGYLTADDTHMYLGIRCILEFAPYFRAQCKDYLTFCSLCSEPVFNGRICAKCNKIMHKFCLAKFLSRQNKCPECKEPWEETFELNQSQMNSTTQDEDSTSSDSDEAQPSTKVCRRR